MQSDTRATLNSRHFPMHRFYLWILCAVALIPCGNCSTHRKLLDNGGAVHTWSHIYAGMTHTCGIDSDGSVFCWGSSYNGQLGDNYNDMSNKYSPWPFYKYSPFYYESFSSLGVGYGITCGIKNETGGDPGDPGDPLCSRPYGGNVQWRSLSFTKISFDRGVDIHSCGIATNGSAFCEGHGNYGQLGNGRGDEYIQSPTLVVGNMQWTSLSVGREYSCGIIANGSAFCWGLGNFGQTGTGRYRYWFPSPKQVFGGMQWTLMTTGYEHTCGIVTNGSAFCWGYNGGGRLGIGKETTQSSHHPVQVAGNMQWALLSAGAYHTCGIVTNGSAFCWGDNGFGQVGIPNITSQTPSDNSYSSPTPVTGDLQWTLLSAGAFYTCGISTNGSAWCWGDNRDGQLGNTKAGGSDWKPTLIDEPSIPSDGTSSGIPLGAIVGGVAGGIVCVLAVGAFIVVRRRRRTTMVTTTETIDIIETIETPKTPTIPSPPPPPPTRPDVASIIVSDIAYSRHISVQSIHHSPKHTSLSSSVSLDLPDHVRTWEFGWNDVRIDHVLGVGSFGKVFLATLNEAPIAIKVLIDAQTHTSGPSIMDSKLVEEAGLLAAMRHPNIVNFLGFCTVPPSIATEYCARGSVFDILQEADATPTGPLAQQLNWPRRVKMVIDAAAGMLYLHTRTPVIIHRDIKSPNLLVTTDWTVKIADFNLSRLLDDTKQAASTIGGGPGNPRWLAPEILQGIKASPASDVYSFGVVMWEMLVWQLPWGDTNSFSVSARWYLTFEYLFLNIYVSVQIPAKVIAGERPSIPSSIDNIPGPRPKNPQSKSVLCRVLMNLDLMVACLIYAGFDGYIAVMKACWDGDIANRPTFYEIIRDLKTCV